ncbi:MAG: hypothetical protein A2176_16090 [Spirochaetes bacterium RBG_13_51_14]|nr:MAG: hypothetical protein A2176_16090 [Spirochaetes bacterium RBG_13_51_14]
MNKVTIQLNPPRDPAQYGEKIDFWHGLRGYLFNGSIFAAAGGLTLVAALSGPYELGLTVFKLIGFLLFGSTGYRNFRRAIRGHRERLEAFMRGRLFRCSIVSQGRAFATWKSRRDYTLIIQVTMENGKVLEKTIRSSDRTLHQRYPLHGEFDALADVGSGFMFAPPEVDIEASFQ